MKNRSFKKIEIFENESKECILLITLADEIKFKKILSTEEELFIAQTLQFVMSKNNE